MVYDLLMLCLLAMTTLRGKAKGIAWQLAGIASLVLCFLFATPLSAAIAPHVPLNEPLNRWVSMLGAYLVFSFGCFSVARAFRGALETSRFEEFDKHLGALFGFVKGVTLCFVITFFAICLSENAAGYVLQTKSGYVAAQIMQQIQPVLPVELQNVMRRAAGQPLVGQDPFAIGQGTDPAADPFNDNGVRPPLPASGDQGFELWREPDDSLSNAPRYQGGGTQPPAGMPIPSPNSAAVPRNRAEFFGNTSGVPAGTSTAPQANPLGQVAPLFSGSTGNGLADKALSALKSFLPGNSQPTPQTPAPVAPMSGNIVPPSNQGSGFPTATPLPAIDDDDLNFAPRTSQQFSPPATSPPRPVGSATPPSRLNDDPFSMPANPAVRPGAAIPEINNSNHPPTNFGSNAPGSSAPRAVDLADDDGFRAPRGNPAVNPNSIPSRDPSFAPRPDGVPLRSQPASGSRSLSGDSRPSPFDDGDALPPARSNTFDNPPSRVGDVSRAPAPGSLPLRGSPDPRNSSAPRPALTGTQPSSFDDDDLPRPAVDPRSGLDSRRQLTGTSVAPVPAHRPSDIDPRRSAPASLSRGRLDDDLRSGPIAPIPGVRTTSQGRPRTGPDGRPLDRTEEIRALTSGIAVLLSPPAHRPAREVEIQRAMQGLTQRTVSHVLRDWQADLLGTGNDPNPQTDVSTPLSQRISLRLAYEQQKAGGRGSSQAPRPR